MLFPVVIRTDTEGRLHASVPDLPGCEAQGSELGRTLTRAHLKIEGRISQMLIDGEALPEPATLTETRQAVENNAAACYEIHINLTHLRAVAKHQAGK